MRLHAVEISNLTFTYENRKEPALTDVNLAIGSQEFVLLAGASGSGKSTLIKCINGLIPHRYVGQYSGEVKVRDQSVPKARFLNLSFVVGTVLQEPDKQLVSSVVEDDIAFGPGNLNLPRSEIERRVKQSLESMGISHLKERSIFALSGGEKQRLAIADVLAMEPEILLFDEPLANLDSNGVRLMQDLFRELHRAGKTIIAAEHRTEEVLKAGPSRVVVIDDGRIVADGSDPTVLMDFADTLKIPAEFVVRHRQTTTPQGPERERVPIKNLGQELLRVENVSFEYPGGIKALDDVSLSIREGERIALLGNNGAGKSTLALSVIGLVKPTLGHVLVMGRDTRVLSTAEIVARHASSSKAPSRCSSRRPFEGSSALGRRTLGWEPRRFRRSSQRRRGIVR